MFMMECEQDDEEEEEAHEPGITLHSLLSGAGTRTIQIEARISEERLVALIDSGSTFNFIDEKAAKGLNLKLTPTKPFIVCLANGTPLWCTGKYQALMMAVKNVNFVLDMYRLPLTGVDVVLGIPWLEQLGTTVCDWKGRSIEFTWSGKRQVLHGLTQHQIQQVQQEKFTTENTSQLEQKFLDQNLEDKDLFYGGSVDRMLQDDDNGTRAETDKAADVAVKKSSSYVE